MAPEKEGTIPPQSTKENVKNEQSEQKETGEDLVKKIH